MTLEALPPGLMLILAGLLLPLVNAWGRAALVLGAPVLTLLLVWLPDSGVPATVAFLGYDIVPVTREPLGRLFATVFAIMSFGGGLFALASPRALELTAALVYAGAAVGAVLAGDLITLFVFWEAMALGSVLVIWAAGAPAFAAGMRYALIHLIGGAVLMAGIAGQVAQTGSVAFTTMSVQSWPEVLILIGFLINAGAPPLSAWIPDSYPEASWSGMVFLSAFTTKTAVYALLRGFAGTEILVLVGLYMVFYGIVYAILENDMRRILAYSIVNQVGFMVAGIGLGSEMALNGAASHAFAHIIYKALLLMAAGSVLLMTGKRKCTDLGGLYHSMPLTMICGIVGALSISAFPLTSGFVTKSMISEAAAGLHMGVAWLLLSAASAGVFLHAGIKFPWFVFFQKDSGLRPPDPPWPMRLAMILFSAICIGIGVFPGLLYPLLPFPVAYVPYTATHVVGMLQLLLFSSLAFFLLLPWLRRTLTITLDFDWFYRRFGRAVAHEFDLRGARALVASARRLREMAVRFVFELYRYYGPDGVLARNWPTGAMALCATAMLLLFLAFPSR
jgi:multicomponent Na+:H+ antiporter subunit D